MKKRVLSLFLALTLCLTLLPTAALAAEDETSAQSAEALLSTEGAEGTAEDPILIGSLSELEAFRYRVNERGERRLCAQLTADITLGSSWTSIGNNQAYIGTFDGNGHTIYAENGVTNLFGTIGNTGKVQDLTVEIDSMTVSSGSGVIAREISVGGTIERCSVRIYGTLTISGGFGLIANQNVGTIEHCRGSVNNFSASNTTASAAGIAYQNYGTIRSCYFAGTFPKAQHYAITASMYGGTVENCYCRDDVLHNNETWYLDESLSGVHGAALRPDDRYNYKYTLENGQVTWLLNNGEGASTNYTEPWRLDKQGVGGTPTLDPADGRVTKNGDGSYTLETLHTHIVGGRLHEFEALSSTPKGSGCYYLGADTTLSGAWTITGETVLCLNGKTLTTDGSAITVAKGGTLTLMTHDKKTGGTVTGEGTIVALQGGTLVIQGGTISGGTTGVDLPYGSTFRMEGGEITGCTTGVSVQGGNLTLSGSAKVTENTQNILLAEASFLSFGVLNADAKFGVSLTYQASMGATDRIAVTDETGGQYHGQLFADGFQSNGTGFDLYLNEDGKTVYFGKQTVHIHELGNDEEVTFQPWTETTSLPQEGNYYLTRNVTLTGSATLKNANICLNGYTITLLGSATRIYVGSNGSKNASGALTDCTGKGTVTGGGVIIQYNSTFSLYNGTLNGTKTEITQSGGTFNMYGGKITNYTGDASTVTGQDAKGININLYGGEISGNHVSGDCGGVWVGAGNAFTMSGGSIKNNTGASAGGVGFTPGNSTYQTGTMTVSGSAVIQGNTAKSLKSNVCLPASMTITVDGALTKGAQIGVRSAATVPGAITGANSADMSGYFTSDDPRYRPADTEVTHVVTLSRLPELTILKGADVTQSYGTEGGKVTLDMRNTEGHTLSYQWYEQTDPNEIESRRLISGATSAEYTIPKDTPVGTYYYYCVVMAQELGETITTQPSTVTITRATQARPLTVSTGWVYGSTVPQPNVTGLPAGVTVDQATVTYTDAQGNAITPGSETPVGNYHVKVEYTDDNADYSGEADFKITPMLVNKDWVKITDTHTTYDGTTKYAWEVITVSVTVNEKTITLSSDDFYVGGVTAAADASATPQKGQLTLQGNYQLVGDGGIDFEWYIDPLEAQLELVNADGRKYGDGLGNVSLKAANAPAFATVTVACDGGDDLSVGRHDITATGLLKADGTTDTNYTLPGSKTLTYTIAKADKPADKDLTMYVYNNLAKTYTYDFSQALPALADGLTFGNCTYKGEPNLTTNVVSGIGFHGSVLTFSTGRISSKEGTTILSYTATVTSDNYKDFRLTLRVQTKDKKAVTVPEADITMNGWTYGQTPNQPSVANLPAGVTPTFTYKNASGEEITPAYTTDAGVYTLTVRYETDDTVYTGTKTFTVAPKTLTAADIPPSSYTKSKTYDGTTDSTLGGTKVDDNACVGTDNGLCVYGTTAFNSPNVAEATKLIFTANGTISNSFDASGKTKASNYTIARGTSWEYPARIDPRPIAFTVDSVSKRLGSNTADVRVTFTSVSGNDQSGLVDGETLEQGVDYDVTAQFSRTDFGTDNNVTVTVTLKDTVKARNYTLSNPTLTGVTGEITKAAAPNVPEQTIEIYSNAETQYAIDLTKGWPAGTPSIFDYPYSTTYGKVNPTLEVDELSDLLYNNASYLCPAPDEWNGTIYINARAFTADVGTDLGVLKVIFKSPNYEDLTLRIRFKVKAKAQETLAVNLEGWTYGEPANPPAYTAPSGAKEMTLTYTSRDGQTSYGTTPPKDAGDYTLTVRCEGIDTIWTGSADFTIAKKQITPPAADTTQFAYTALEQTYQLAANEAYTVSPNTTQKNAGSYTITASLNDPANTEWTDGTMAAKEYTFTIAPAALTVTALNKQITAGQPAPDLTTPVLGEDYTVDGLLGQDALTAVTLTYGETPDTSKTGSYTIDISAVQANYDITTVPGTLTIAPRPSSGGGSTTYPINTPDKTENGTVTVSRRYAERGDTVTITVKPDDGFKLDELTVIDKNGNKLKLTDKGNGKYTFTMPASKVEVNATFVKKVETSPFSDVPTGAYYYEAVKWAQEKGITGGIGNGLFGSNQPCTRAQAVTFLWRAAGSPAPESTAMAFTDVPAGSYYYNAVLWAMENGITVGTSDTTFSPDATCSRAQIVTFLWRAEKSPAAGSSNPFTDVAADAYYANAVLWAVKENITAGTTTTTFAPDANCTRAQIVTFLYRMYQAS